jgi:hypothetical protein
MRESEFKKSSKIAAKEGYIIFVWDNTQQIGASTYTKNFIQKSWFEFGSTLSRFTSRSSKIQKIEAYHAKHSIMASLKAKRSLSSMEWRYIDEDIFKEVQRTGKPFFYADKQGGILKPYVVISKAKKVDVEYDKRGNVTNKDEIMAS